MTEETWEYLDEPIDDDDEVIDKREFLDDDGIDIFSKKSIDKTVEERIKTSRSLKIKNNKWNNVEYGNENLGDKIVIDPHYCHYNSSFEDVEFENKFQEIIENSKYKPLLIGEEKVTINYQVMNDILIYCYARMKTDYSLTQIFVLLCEYCSVGLNAMWKRLSSYLQIQILEELKDISKLPKEILDNEIKLF